MGQCNAKTDSPSGTTKKETPLQSTLRGLELIKSCARFYENGVGVAKPTVQLSYPLGAALNQHRTRQTFSSRLSRARISTVAVICLFFLVLPSLALAMIVWSATKNGSAKGMEVAADNASAVSAQASPAITPLRNLPAAGAAKTASNAQSGIIIRRVKTQPIVGDALGGPNQ
jgi:hypothetical protein